MKRFSLLGCAVLMLATFAMAGCSSNTLTMNAHERSNVHKKVYMRDRRALNEDVDWLLLQDRPSRLSRWHEK